MTDEERQRLAEQAKAVLLAEDIPAKDWSLEELAVWARVDERRYWLYSAGLNKEQADKILGSAEGVVTLQPGEVVLSREMLNRVGKDLLR